MRESKTCFSTIPITRAFMKLQALLLPLLLGTCLAIVGWPNRAVAEGPAKSARPEIYDETADGAKQIAAALVTAKKENKRVLLQFGANWCGWCHKLHELCASDKTIADQLKSDY